MTVLVTGAPGFIGSHVCRALLARGASVRAVGRPGSDRRRLPESSSRLAWLECDLFDADAATLREMCRDVEACIHAAWGVVPGEYLTSPRNDAYRAGSLRLFTALVEQGCRKITGIGTCFEYEQRSTPLDEGAALNPTTPYASAKLSTFVEGEALARQAGVAFAWARLFYLYGPGEDPRRLVPDVAQKLLRGERAAVTAGRQVRDFLHVEDVARAIVAITESSLSGPVNVGSANPVRVCDIVRCIGSITGRLDLIDFGARPDNLVDPPFVCADNRRLRTGTDWQPRYDLHDGLRQTIASWQA